MVCPIDVDILTIFDESSTIGGFLFSKIIFGSFLVSSTCLDLGRIANNAGFGSFLGFSFGSSICFDLDRIAINGFGSSIWFDLIRNLKIDINGFVSVLGSSVGIFLGSFLGPSFGSSIWFDLVNKLATNWSIMFLMRTLSFSFFSISIGSFTNEFGLADDQVFFKILGFDSARLVIASV